MGTIDKYLVENAGARGCGDSDYNLAITTCCGTYVIEDDELHDVYFDPTNLSKVVGVEELERCPVCLKKEWDYTVFAEWPRKETPWMWAYHKDIELVSKWIRKDST